MRDCVTAFERNRRAFLGGRGQAEGQPGDPGLRIGTARTREDQQWEHAQERGADGLWRADYARRRPLEAAE